MKLFELGVVILLFYIPIWAIVNRICTCVEKCKCAKYGQTDENTKENGDKKVRF